MLMAVAVILMLADSGGAGFVMALIVVGVAAVLLGLMFVADVAHSGDWQSERRSYRRTQASGF